MLYGGADLDGPDRALSVVRESRSGAIRRLSDEPPITYDDRRRATHVDRVSYRGTVDLVSTYRSAGWVDLRSPGRARGRVVIEERRLGPHQRISKTKIGTKIGATPTNFQRIYVKIERTEWKAAGLRVVAGGKKQGPDKGKISDRFMLAAK